VSTRIGTCVYCGEERRLTHDHVPPRGLCAKPRPHDLVIVPSCTRCNEGASKDDEYFKTVMVWKETAGSHPEATKIRDSVFRGLAMPKKATFARRLLAGLQDVDLKTPAGLHAGRATGFDVDLARLDRVVERVTRGLYWHSRGHRRLPSDHTVTVWSEHGLRGLQPKDASDLRRTLVEPILNNPPRSIARGVLRYWYAEGDLEHVTGWLLEFYGDVRFVAFTVPELRASLDPR
jgi:hypothetical protein